MTSTTATTATTATWAIAPTKLFVNEHNEGTYAVTSAGELYTIITTKDGDTFDYNTGRQIRLADADTIEEDIWCESTQYLQELAQNAQDIAQEFGI